MVKVPTRNEYYCAMFPGDLACKEFLMGYSGNPTTCPPTPFFPAIPLAVQGSRVAGRPNALPGQPLRNDVECMGGTGDGTAVSNKGIPGILKPGTAPSSQGRPRPYNPDKPPVKPNRIAMRSEVYRDPSDHRYWDLDKPEPGEIVYELK